MKRPHKKRRVVTQQEPLVYMNNQEMAKLAATDEEQFVRMVKMNQITDLSRYKGYNLANDSFIMLESGR